MKWSFWFKSIILLASSLFVTCNCLPQKKQEKQNNLVDLSDTAGLTAQSQPKSDGTVEKSYPLIESIKRIVNRKLDNVEKFCYSQIDAMRPPDKGNPFQLEAYYWAVRGEELYNCIILGLVKHQVPHPDQDQSYRLRKAVTITITAIRLELRNLEPADLIRLFWILHDAISKGNITPDGDIIIDGERYNIRDILAYCCPMG